MSLHIRCVFAWWTSKTSMQNLQVFHEKIAALRRPRLHGGAKRAVGREQISGGVLGIAGAPLWRAGGLNLANVVMVGLQVVGTSNNTLLWLSDRLRRSCQGGAPAIGERF